MAEDNPTNPNSGEKNPNHDPFDMLKGDAPAGNTPPPEKQEDTPSTTGSDPFDMIEKHPTSNTGTTTPTPTVNTGSSDPFDMVEKHPTTSSTPTNTGTTSQPDLPKPSEDPLSMVGQPNNPTSQPDLPKPSEDPLSMVGQPNNPTSQPDLPKPSEDPLSMVGQPNNPTGTTSQPDLSKPPMAGQPNNPVPPPTTSIPMPTGSPVPNPPPPNTSSSSSTVGGGKNVLEREAYKSNLDLNAVLAAADKVNRMPKLQNTSLEKLDEALFTKRNNTKVSPEEQAEVEQKLQYLVNKIKKDLAFYSKKEKKSGKWTLIFSVLSSLLAASVTVLLGLNVTDFMRQHNLDWYINTTALVISAFISVIGVLQNFTDSKPLWIKYTDTSNKYQQLLDNIEYMQLASSYITLDDVNQIKLAYNRIKDGTNNYIIQVRSQDDSTGNSSMIRT
jgi:UDP-N-acetylglucosamine transferase subunit ALG13